MSVTTTPQPDLQAGESTPTARRIIHRQILPVDRDMDVMALYVDPFPAAIDNGLDDAGAMEAALNAAATTGTGHGLHPDQILDRHTVRVTAGDELSFGTYFNAFPASYWRRWSIVDQVRLVVRLRGNGGVVTVYRSTANGRSQRVDSAAVSGESGEFTFDLTLKPFIDGGWYWYDVTAGDVDVEVTAEWDALVPADRVDSGTVAISITTMNRPEFCSELLSQVAGDSDLHAILDRVYVMEQGTQKVVDAVAYPAARDALGEKLRVIEQGNLGGSGGYARGQLETVKAGTATYSMMMDDDVICEPEGIIRAVTFADLAKTPTIVGGHMFSLYARTRLHSFGEVVTPWNFLWESPGWIANDWDFAARNLRSARWLHRRADVDFNGWFMCLIPTETLREIGLSLPVFIKWDDSEYGLRAAKAGYPTVTMPGAAVWHVPWTDKNDAVDWQSYFHQRNRLVAALLHSPFEHGGKLLPELFSHQVKHIASMQYSTAELRLQAMEDVLAGPGDLHATLATKLPEVNAFRKQYSDATLKTDVDAFPSPKRAKPKRGGKDKAGHVGTKDRVLRIVSMPLRQVRKPRDLSRTNPEATVSAMDATWARLASLDSAVVSMRDGTSAAFYQRDPAQFKDLMKRSVALHRRIYAEWPRLAALYRAELDHITSPEAWEETFRPWTDSE